MEAMEVSTPVSMRSNISNTYDDAFPALPKPSVSGPVSKWEPPLPAYHSVKTTEILEIPMEERRFQQVDFDGPDGTKRYETQRKICSEIAKNTGVHIDLNSSKSHTLSIIIAGEPSKVAQAKCAIAAELQQQATIKLRVPPEYHGFLIGRRGDRLRELQAATMTRINIPGSNSSEPDVVIVTGPRQGIVEAERRIMTLVEEQSHQGYERLNIPKIYHPFICGPNNQYINELKERTGTKIDIPPPIVQADDIAISGLREGVAEAAHEIRRIYEERLETCKTISIRIRKSQHRLILGPRGVGIAEILASTGVSVELPSDPNSEQITLRGNPEDLGRALSMVYGRAESSVTEEIAAPNRFHKLLIGKQGSTIAQLREGYEKVRIEFGERADKILIEGPPEEVSIIAERLQARVAELEATISMTTIEVDPKYHRHIVGRGGSTIQRLRDYKVQIRMPNSERGDKLSASEIVIEGDPEGVEKAKADILQLVEKLENEKCKDVIIEPRIQQLLFARQNGVQPIASLYETFPNVSIAWPENNVRTPATDAPSGSVVQLRGPRQQVDGAAERLQKLIKSVIEENYRQEIRIFKEFRPNIIGRGSANIRKLLDETKTRIQYPEPSTGSDIFTIIGREENVHQMIRRIEDLQKKLANIKEVVVPIPSMLTKKFAGDQAPSLRSICEQCDGVNIRFLNPVRGGPRKTGQIEVVVIGPADAVKKAEQLLEKLNSKVAQLCAEEIVHTDPKYHGFLIGRQGSNIIQFRERHNVELLFPDRTEDDPKLASEIRIVGTKESVAKAKAELEKLIKTMEDEAEVTVQIDSRLLKEFNNYRRSFPHPDLDRVRVITPRSPIRQMMNQSASSADFSESDTTNIKLIGQKACVEAASSVLRGMIDDLKNQITREVPITDPFHCSILEKARSRMPDLEKNYKVYIRLSRGGDTSSPQSSSAVTPSSSATGESKYGSLFITGRPEQIDAVLEHEIKPLLPIDERIPLSQEFHRSLIVPPMRSQQSQRRFTRGAANNRGRQFGAPENDAQKMEDVPAEQQSKILELKQKYGIFVRLPPQHSPNANYIDLRGTPDQVALAKADLNEWLQKCEAEKADRIARNYKDTMEVPNYFVQQLLATRQTIYANHNVNLRVEDDAPFKNYNNYTSPSTTTALADHTDAAALNEDTQPTDEAENVSPNVKLVLCGYKDNVAAAKRELQQLLEKLEREVTESLCIPKEVHSHLIGARGLAIQKVMSDFKVRIEFPSRTAKDDAANTVFVSGDPHDVDQACDYLIGKANDLMVRLQSENRNVRRPLMEENLFSLVNQSGMGQGHQSGGRHQHPGKKATGSKLDEAAPNVVSNGLTE